MAESGGFETQSRSVRRGIVGSLTAEPASWLLASTALSVTDAFFQTNVPNVSKRVPSVPPVLYRADVTVRGRLARVDDRWLTARAGLGYTLLSPLHLTDDVRSAVVNVLNAQKQMSTKSARSTNRPSLRKLRRIGVRALRVLEEKKKVLPTLKVFEQTLVPVILEYVGIYDAARHSRVQEKHLGVGQDAVNVLEGKLRFWLGPVSKDIPNLARDHLGDNPVPDDVIAGARQILDVVRGFTHPSGEPLHYLGELEQDLLPAIDAAEQAWAAAQAKRMEHQARQGDIRVAAARLQRELVAFRRSLRGAFGDHDLGYQTLRSHAADGSDELEDETTSPTPEESVSPSAPAGASNGSSDGHTDVVVG